MIVFRILGKILLVILKMLLLPVVAVLYIAVAFLSFVLIISGVILGILSVIVAIMAILMLVTSNIPGGIAFLVIAFLVSPLGLPRLAAWLIEAIGDVLGMLKSFIFARV